MPILLALKDGEIATYLFAFFVAKMNLPDFLVKNCIILLYYNVKFENLQTFICFKDWWSLEGYVYLNKNSLNQFQTI